MGDSKISALAAVGSYLTTHEYAVNEGGASKKISGAQIQVGNGRIDRQLLGAGAASITFTNPLPTIPAYDNLEIAYYARGDTAAATTTISIKFNNVATATYDWQTVFNNAAATAAAAEFFAQNSIQLGTIPANTATAGYFGIGRFIIPNHAGNVGNKSISGQSFYADTDATLHNQVHNVAGKWRTTATPITRIDLIPGAGNFVTGSLFTLRGWPT
jgi:hypothetical protein